MRIIFTEDLQSFLVASNKKSLSMAADALHITQPTLSYRIKKLEKDLGFKLIERNWEGIRLSDEGQYFLPYAIRILQDLKNAQNVIGLNSGDNKANYEVVHKNDEIFRIGINSLLSPVFTESFITELSNNHPDLEFEIITRPTNILKNLIDYKGIDLAVYYGNETQMETDSFLIRREELVLICHEDDFHDIQKSLNDLQSFNKPFLFYDNPILSNNIELLDIILMTLNVRAFKALDNLIVMASYIGTKKGYTITPASSVSQIFSLSSAPLKIISFGDMFPHVEIHMSHQKDSKYKPSIASLINLFK